MSIERIIGRIIGESSTGDYIENVQNSIHLDVPKREGGHNERACYI